MKEELNNIMLDEIEALKKLLALLEKQYELVLKKDIFGLEALIDEIQECNKEVAQQEVKRRNLIKEDSMSKVIDSLGDEELDTNYRNIKKLLEEVILQKDDNELILKQSLSYTNQILRLINPSREFNTYKITGKIQK